MDESKYNSVEQSNIDHKRDTGTELLRIVAMLMIIAHHFSFYGDWSLEGLSSNNVIIEVLALGGKVGVDIFVLITGYYSLNYKFSIRKIVRLLCQISFYSVTLYVISVLVKAQPITFENIVFAIFPELAGNYWFATTYLLFLFLIPFLNIVIKNISHKQHVQLILFFCVFGQFCLTQLDKLSII